MSAVLGWLLKIYARSLLFRENFKFLIANINRGDLVTFGELITAGKVTAVIDRRYSLSGTADAMVYAEAGHARAKVVIMFE
jgi:alcohol dehydrogenase